MLDFESGSMSFSVNGSTLGAAFTEKGHGSTPDDDAVTPDRYGPSWDSGFFPALTVGIDQSVVWNLGQSPFLYAPVGFLGVCHLDQDPIIGPKDCILPYNLKQWDSLSSQWISAKYGESTSLPINDSKGFFCYLQPSMRINFSLPVRHVDEKIQIVTMCSSKTLTPRKWTHCLIRVDMETNIVEFVLNGEPDSSQVFQDAVIQSNIGPISFGVMPSKFAMSDYLESHVWVAKVQWIYSTIPHFEDVHPFHQKVLSDLVDYFTIEENSSTLKTMKTLCQKFDHSLQPKALEILLSMALFDDNELLLEKALGVDGVVVIVMHLLDALESVNFHKPFDAKIVHYMKTLSSLSETSIGRAVLVKLDAMIRLISILPLTASNHLALGPIFFWAEICISNLHIPKKQDKFEEYLDTNFKSNQLAMDDWVFFKSPVQPFSPLPSFPCAWEHMPIGIWVRSFLLISI
jgi:hypothetical protein